MNTVQVKIFMSWLIDLSRVKKKHQKKNCWSLLARSLQLSPNFIEIRFGWVISTYLLSKESQILAKKFDWLTLIWLGMWLNSKRWVLLSRKHLRQIMSFWGIWFSFWFRKNLLSSSLIKCNMLSMKNILNRFWFKHCWRAKNQTKLIFPNSIHHRSSSTKRLH